MAERRKLRVLFVDDDPAVRETWQYLFGTTFDATLVSSGEEALELLRDPPGGERFDVLVSDHRMPGLTGAELCRRAAEVSPDTARVIVTAYRDREARICPCAARLEKPCSDVTMAAVIEEAASGRRESTEELRDREREAEKAVEEARDEFRRVVERTGTLRPAKVYA